MAGPGGKRPGAGRKKGKKNQKTLEKEKILEEVKQRIMRRAQNILDAQMSIAQGQQFLYRIDTTIKDKGVRTKSKPILVTDPEEISEYLDGEYGDGENVNTETEYYFITTKEPNNMAIDSMMNRAFGKPQENVDITTKGEKVYLWGNGENNNIHPKKLGD